MAEKLFGIDVIRGDASADILLYDFIGEMQDFFTGEKYGISAKGILSAISELEKEYDTINIRLNSPGGSMIHGNAIVNALKNSKSKIKTYNDGLAASMASVIFLSAEEREMADNALLMFHAPSTYLGFTNAVNARKNADVLDQFEETALNVISKKTGFDKAELKEKFFDGDDHWLTLDDAVAFGLVSAPATDSNMVSGFDASALVGKSYGDVVNAYTGKNTVPDMKENLITRITNAVTDKIAALIKPAEPAKIEPQNITEMTEDFKNSLESGDLNLEDVQAHITSMTAEAETETTAEAVEVAEEPTPAEPDIIDALKAEYDAKLAALQAEITAMKKAPGAEPTASLSEGDHYTQAEIDAQNKRAFFAEQVKNLQ